LVLAYQSCTQLMEKILAHISYTFVKTCNSLALLLIPVGTPFFCATACAAHGPISFQRF
jgi:hypothetical protein